MNHLLLAAGRIHDFWYMLPLILAVSLVYAATRHERLGPILVHAVRIGMWIVSFMAVVFVVLWLLGKAA